MAVKDETGNRYGKLIVLHRVENNYRGDAQWMCQCDCGQTTITKGTSLRSGHTKSCGCFQKEVVKAQGFKNTYDLIGKVFGKLTVVERLPGSGDERGKWRCTCECGGEAIVPSDKLMSGHTMSCGCLQSKNIFNIAKILSELKIKFIKEYSFQDLKSDKNYVLRYDFAIFDEYANLKFLLEYDGEQHTQTKHPFYTESGAFNDILKNEYATNNDIRLYRISYQEEAIPELLKILKKEGMHDV